jgi:NADPH-dependent 2,4-dienoyl-CoA reductase/sulfur reductase-like enzyme/rhodanese-related sulfurtransferase
MSTQLLIIGGVAGGATAAARARRISESAGITVLERGPYVSYANCGLPYFISRDIQKRSQLLLQTPESFARRYNVQVEVDTEVLELDLVGKRVRAKGPAGERWIAYDKLILAQGGLPIQPQLPGVAAPHVFRMWTVPDTDRLDGYLIEQRPQSAVVVGGGFIGIEMAEALRRRGLAVTVVELLPTLMSVMDREFGVRVERELIANGVQVLTGVGVKAVLPAEKQVELSDGRRLPGELVLFSVGVRPELPLARQAGLAIGASGGLLVDEHLRTSAPEVWAAGDMVEVVQRISGRKVRVPLAGPANRQGRIAASNALGLSMKYRGALGTSVVKVFEATAASTGLTERAAREAGFQVGIATVHKEHHAGYYPGAKELSLHLVYERPTGRLLGAQGFGHAGVEKRIDVAATALHAGLTVHDVAELDLSYAPPYSSANDPLNLAAFVAENDLSGFSPAVTPAELARELASTAPPIVLDVRTPAEWAEGHLEGAAHIPVDALRSRLGELQRDKRIVVYCRVGFRGHLALRILKESGFGDVANVTGGWLSMEVGGGFPVQAG